MGKLIAKLPIGDSKHTYKWRDGKDALVAIRKESGSFPTYYRPAGEDKYERVTATKLADESLPLYNLSSVADYDGENSIVLVSNEYSADVVALTLPQPVVTWLGDMTTLKKTDWSPLVGKQVTILSDATADCRRTMRYLSDMLWTIGVKRIKSFYPPLEGMPGFQGHTVAEWLEQCVNEHGVDKVRRQQLFNDLQQHMIKYTPSNTMADVEAFAQRAMQERVIGERAITKARVNDMLADNPHFSVLGRAGGHIVCQMKESAELVSFKADSITKTRMIQLADIEFWRDMADDDNLAEDSLDEIRNGINRKAQEKGMIDMANMRGRGAIEDGGDYYYHLGNKLLTEKGEFVALGDQTESKYIYIECPPLPWKPPRNGWQKRAAMFSSALEMFNFKTRQDYLTWLGWMGTALVCGVMNWRVHLWLTGESQAGKSWLIMNSAMRLMGDFVEFSADYSEAAIARLIQNDALPLILDEGEPSDKAMEKIVSMLKVTAHGDAKRIRSSSGSASGVFITTPRASLVLASTQILSMGQTEASRIEVVRLNRPDRTVWKEMDARIEESMSDGWADDIRNGIICSSKQISKLSKLFENMASTDYNCGSRRAKIAGMIFAGATLMGADVTKEDVRNFCGSESTKNDNEDLLSTILDLIVEVTVPVGDNAETTKKVAVHEMLSMCLGKAPAHRICTSASRYGLRLKKDGGVLHMIIDPNIHTLLMELKRQTNIKNIDIGASLKMIDGVIGGKRANFNGNQRRCLMIPESVISRIGYKFTEEIKPGAFSDEGTTEFA